MRRPTYLCRDMDYHLVLAGSMKATWDQVVFSFRVYSMKFSQRVHIPPSATLAMNSAAQEKKKKGETVFNLTTGEPRVPLSSFIQEGALKAMQSGKTFYTPTSGIVELREKAFEWMNINYGTHYTLENSFATNGGKYALYALFQAFLETGDEILILDPYWVSYPSMAHLAGATSKILSTTFENGWKITVSEIQNALCEKTKMLILNNGSNPTGVLYTREELKNIAKVCFENNILLVSDEVYSGLTYDDAEYVSCGEFSEFVENIVVVQSMSKNFAMSGWRVGFIFATKEIISQLSTFQGQSTSGTSSISQWAAVAAFEHSKEIMPEIKHELEMRRNIFAEKFEKIFQKKIPVPKCGLYYFIPMHFFGSVGENSLEFCMQMLDRANVAMVPGIAFGKEGYVRCSFGGEMEEIEQALENLGKVML